jgi:hypothetical protein
MAEWEAVRAELLDLRAHVDRVVALVDRVVAMEGREEEDAVVIGGQGIWTAEDVSAVLPSLSHLVGPMTAFRLCAKQPDQWISFSSVHDATGTESPIQTRNEFGAMTRILTKQRGVSHWPLVVERIDGEVHYMAPHPMSEWLGAA